MVAETPWRHQKLLGGGGGSIDIGVHQLHWMRYVVGEVAAVGAAARTFEPLRYAARWAGPDRSQQVRADVDDTYMATIVFERGALGQLWWSWAMRGEALEIPGAPALMGSHGAVRGDEMQLERWAAAVAPGGVRAGADAEPSASSSSRLGCVTPMPSSSSTGYRRSSAGPTRRQVGEEGLRDLACAFAILESSALGRQVTLDEVLDSRVDGYQQEIDQHYGLI